MIVPYLPTDKVIHASNGSFIIIEVEEGYELWEHSPRKLLITHTNINYFRKRIGEVYKLS